MLIRMLAVKRIDKFEKDITFKLFTYTNLYFPLQAIEWLSKITSWEIGLNSSEVIKVYGGDWDDEGDGGLVLVGSNSSEVIKVYGCDWEDNSDGWGDCWYVYARISFIVSSIYSKTKWPTTGLSVHKTYHNLLKCFTFSKQLNLKPKYRWRRGLVG